MITKHGQFILGDAIDEMQKLPSGSVDVIASDVSYKVIVGGNKNPKGPKGMMAKGGQHFPNNDVKPEEYMPEMFRVLKSGGHCYIFTNNKNIRRVLNIAHKLGFHHTNTVYWKKNNKNPNRYYMMNVETILFFYKRPAVTINNPGTAQMIELDGENVAVEMNNPKNKKHPTEKPVDLMKVLIENSSHVGQTVLDPFAGSAPTMIAAIETGRRFIGVEIDEVYYYAACGRIIESENKT